FDLYAAQNASFRHYAINLLVFAPLRRWSQLDAQALDERIGAFALDNSAALAGLLAWHHHNKCPLPARYANVLALATNEAKRGLVLQRSPKEVVDLFTLRYREAHGDGLLLDAAARPLTIDYNPASATLVRTGKRISVKLPNVLGKYAQLGSLVRIWN